MKTLKNKMMELVRDEEGATAVEYGVLIALIIAVCIVVIEVLGGKINNAFQTVNNKLN